MGGRRPRYAGEGRQKFGSNTRRGSGTIARSNTTRSGLRHGRIRYDAAHAYDQLAGQQSNVSSAHDSMPVVAPLSPGRRVQAPGGSPSYHSQSTAPHDMHTSGSSYHSLPEAQSNSLPIYPDAQMPSTYSQGTWWYLPPHTTQLVGPYALDAETGQPSPISVVPHVTHADATPQDLSPGISGDLKGKGKARTPDAREENEALTQPPDERSESISTWNKHVQAERPPLQVVGSSGSDSYPSTTSSFLSKYFPKRYFILKSFTKDDLDRSVVTGQWSTQLHNQDILDRAFRTSEEVFLIFSVNGSGEFYGYAKMTSAIFEVPLQPAQNPEEMTPSLSDGPPTASPTESKPSKTVSAPAVLGFRKPAVRLDKDPKRSSLDIALARKSSVPLWRAAGETSQTAHTLEAPAARVSEDVDEDDLPKSGESNRASRGAAISAPGVGTEATPSRPFRISWICTDRLPFNLTNHLRNPWNLGGPVKVSRDGIELEPGIGEMLVGGWRSMLADAPTALDDSASPTGGDADARRKGKARWRGG